MIDHTWNIGVKTSMLQHRYLAVIAGALGYFVDLFDLLLYQIYRVPSLKELGLSEEELLTVGSEILNYQLFGLLLGGIFFGYIGDKLGRKEALFATIALYSVSTLLCAFVSDVLMYSVLRFICGFGLAGELGAAVTLASEQLDENQRGWGVAILTAFGISGVIVASLLAQHLYWRHGYVLGGVMGLLLLIFRMRVSDSDLFKKTKFEISDRGNLLKFVKSAKRIKKLILLILSGAHTWAIVGVWMTFTPEISKSIGLPEIPAYKAVLWTYIGITVGDFLLASLSQFVKSRLRVIRLAHVVGVFGTLVLMFNQPDSEFQYLSCLFILAVLTTNWAVILLSCAETFGTNFRALSTTSLPNFIRASAVISVYAFKSSLEFNHFVVAMVIIGTLSALGFVATYLLDETYGRNLDFYE